MDTSVFRGICDIFVRNSHKMVAILTTSLVFGVLVKLLMMRGERGRRKRRRGEKGGLQQHRELSVDEIRRMIECMPNEMPKTDDGRLNLRDVLNELRKYEGGDAEWRALIENALRIYNENDDEQFLRDTTLNDPDGAKGAL